MKKFILVLISLLLVGVMVTLYLPTLPTTNQPITPAYQLDKESLTKPYPMASFLLITPFPKETKFALRIGLYSELSQAIDKAKLLNASSPTDLVTIIKAIDLQREWYFLLAGPYSTPLLAEQKKQALQNQQISSTLSLWPEKANTNEDE
ncbi:hypothetical protein [Marinomonas sp. THO17]|uniref:SPOR domain-containing protein n=1 Tax=Marinomonas sp. THO17 TaxID=3149048 RepID=UPI00336C16FE